VSADVQQAGKELANAALVARPKCVQRKCGACGKPCRSRTHTKVEFIGLTCVVVDVWFVCGPQCAAKLGESKTDATPPT
jgi:hypothetical protein